MGRLRTSSVVLLLLCLCQPPRNKRIVDECLEDSHQALLVLPHDLHSNLGCGPEAPLDPANLHRLRQHPREPERYPLGELFTVHGNFKAVAKVNVHDLARHAVHEQVGWVTVTQAHDVPYHTAHGERTGIGRSTLEPGLRVCAGEPKNTVEVLASCIVQSVLEDLQLLEYREIDIVGSHLKEKVNEMY